MDAVICWVFNDSTLTVPVDVTILSTSFGKKNDPSEEERLAPDTDRATPLSYSVEIQRPMGQDWNKWTGGMEQAGVWLK